MKYGALRKELGEIFEGLEKVQIERQAELAKAIEGFLASDFPIIMSWSKNRASWSSCYAN